MDNEDAISYRFTPYLIGPLTACRVQPYNNGGVRDEAISRQGRLIGRLCGSSNYFSDSYPYLNGTDTIYVDEFFRFVNEDTAAFASVNHHRKNPYNLFGRRLESMKRVVQRGLLSTVRRLLFTGVTCRVSPISETRVGEEELLIGDGDMSQLKKNNNDVDDDVVTKYFKIERDHFIDLKRYDVRQLVYLMYKGALKVSDPNELLSKCELINEPMYSLNGAALTILIYISPVTGMYNWIYLLHEGTLYDDMIKVINETVTNYEEFVPMIAMELGRTNPNNNSVPYRLIDDDIYLANFVVYLGSREDWRVYLPVPYAIKESGGGGGRDGEDEDEDESDYDHDDDGTLEKLRKMYLEKVRLEEEEKKDVEKKQGGKEEEDYSPPYTLSFVKKRARDDDDFKKENEVLTNEMRLFAIYWYMKNMKEEKENDRSYSRHKAIFGLTDASPYIMSASSVWINRFEDVVVVKDDDSEDEEEESSSSSSSCLSQFLKTNNNIIDDHHGGGGGGGF